MDRTTNELLQQISSLTNHSVNSNTSGADPTGKPVDDAFITNLLEAAAQIEPEAVESPAEEFGSELSLEELLFAAQALLSEGDLSVDTDHATNEISTFAKDPYVAGADELQAVTAVPKSVEEILQTISGYEAEPETDHVPDTNTEFEPSTDSPTLDRPTSKLDLATPTIEQLEQQARLDSETFREPTHSEFNVSVFADATDKVEGTPAPIRGAYEVDHELFDYQIVEEPEFYADNSQAREDQAASDIHALDSSFAPSGLESTAAETDAVNAMEITADDETSQDDNYFWANAGDVITIDGNHGYGHIDLACFDVSDATFRDNQIQIACDDGTSFLIEYCNVTFAIFADGVEIELTTEEPDSNQA